MAILRKYTEPWHVGDTARPFDVQFAGRLGAAMPLLSATFELLNRDADNATLIPETPCNGAPEDLLLGLASYRPTEAEMQTACRVLAQFRATLLDSTVWTVQIEGEILPTY